MYYTNIIQISPIYLKFWFWRGAKYFWCKIVFVKIPKKQDEQQYTRSEVKPLCTFSQATRWTFQIFACIRIIWLSLWREKRKLKNWRLSWIKSLRWRNSMKPRRFSTWRFVETEWQARVAWLISNIWSIIMIERESNLLVPHLFSLQD